MSTLALRSPAADLRVWGIVVFGLALILSSGPAYTFALPSLPAALQWKQVVAADLAFALLIALCALPLTPGLSFRRPALWVVALVLIAAIAFTVMLSPKPRAGLPDLARLAYSLTVCVLVAAVRLSPGHLRLFAIAHTVGTLAVCLAILGAYALYRTAGVPSSLLWINAEPGWSLGSSVRAIGPFAHPTTLVVFLHSALFYLVVLWQLVPRRRWIQLLCGAALASVVAVLPLTYSRAVFAIVLSAFILSALSRPTRWIPVARTLILGQAAVAVVVLCVIMHVWNVFPVSLHFDRDSKFLTVQLYGANEERYFLYRAAVQMFAESPVIGVGPGLYGENLKRHVTLSDYWDALKYYYTQHERLIDRWTVGPDPHSSWFGWLARSGLVGIGGFVVFFGWVIRRLVVRARHADAVIARTAIAFLIGFLAAGFIVEIVHLKLFWLFLGWALATTREPQSP
jgi:O-antigen ligase